MADNPETTPITSDFSKILGDFICDLYRTFPELQETADERVVMFLETVENKTMDDSSVVTVAIRDHCKGVFPERFFDILYKNGDMFGGDDVVALEFIPGINFSHVWTLDGITDSIKATIWKYLQLVLFSVVENGTDAASFGDTAKLFEAIDEDELRTKLEETMAQMKDAFVGGEGGGEGADADGDNVSGDGTETSSGPQIPNADDIHSHLKGMLRGKIGSLAQEIAEETAADLDIGEEDAADVQGVFQKLFKNPGKLMGLVKNVGTKLDTKIKSGDLKESELLEEATEIMAKMKDMPGMGNIQDMMKKMGMGDMMNQMMGGGAGGGKNTRPVSTKSVETQLANQLRQAKEKERRVEEMERRREAKEAEKEAARHADVMASAQPDLTPEQMDALVFSMGETVERSTAADKPKKKKKKKKK